MRGQVTLDTLITSAAMLTVAVTLLASFYSMYTTAEEGIRKSHLNYLAKVIEDRMAICDVVDGSKIYAPYDVNVLCSTGKVCWKNICVGVECRGGGSGKTFILKDCYLRPI